MTVAIILAVFFVALIIIGKATEEPFNDIPIIIGAVGFIGLVLTVAFMVSIGFGSVSCTSRVESQGFESRYGVLSGCQIKDGDRWVDYDKWRYLGKD